MKETDKKWGNKEEDLELKVAFEDENDDEKTKVACEEIELPWFVKKEHVLF